MSHQISRAYQGVRRRCAAWTRRRLDEATHCRQCGQAVQPMDNVCPHCGAGGPAQVSRSAGVAIVGLTVFLLSVYWVLKLTL